ncbi:MAG TPA: nitronate monooxygenase family protein [Flavobacteriales bacterium]|nr:nitronate monooxygenase family protein [Flavobacteriales bacterium]
MRVKTSLTDLLHIDFPVIMAPMFLVSNGEMVKSAIKSGIAGAFPSLNFRNEGELDQLLADLNETLKTCPNGSYGVNLIVQKTNPLYEKHLATCVKHKVPFYITSLGNPATVIEQAHAYGAKVFCDITNLEHAKKCADLGCDGFIAVGQGAGGHAGPFPLQVLIPTLRKNFPNVPVIAAGGIATGEGLLSVISLGAAGASIGTRFIASTEATVSNEYKNAIVDSHMQDIVMTEKLSGTPCTIINTPYAKKIGYKQNWLERWLSKGKRTKKWFKTLVQLRGFKRLEKAVKPGNYDNLWCAGQSVELIGKIEPCEKLIQDMKNDFFRANDVLQEHFKTGL